jgi:type I restriction enzyme S subunit
MEYSKLLLGNIANYFRGLAVPRDRTSINYDIPYLHYGDVYKKYDYLINLSSVKNQIIKIKKSEKINKNQFLHTGDIVINLTSENYQDLGKSIYIVNNEDLFVAGMETTIIRINNDLFDNEFLKYYFDTKYFYNDIIQYVRGMKVFRVNPNDLMRAKLPNVDLSKQKLISSKIREINSLIELNKSKTAILEELTHTLFKRWFVDFEFNNEKGKPYKSSGGEMVESELGLIPKGWEVKSLKILVKKNSDKATKSKDLKLIDMATMPSSSIGLTNYSEGDKLSTNTFQMRKFSILYGSIRPYLKKYGIAPFDGITTGTIHNFTVNDENDYSFVAAVVFSELFNQFCIKLSHGTKMPVINWNDFTSYKVPYNNQVNEIFNEIAKPFFEIIVNNVLQNIELNKLRDLLLPKLMSGEIEVPDMEKHYGD